MDELLSFFETWNALWASHERDCLDKIKSIRADSKTKVMKLLFIRITAETPWIEICRQSLFEENSALVEGTW